MNFVLSYSCGKDSTLALHKMIAAGHHPVGLLVMINKDMERSWFHGVDFALLNKISESLEIPLIKCESSGEDYHIALENGLKTAKGQGATACVFGDIDIEDHAVWCRERCKNVGIDALFTLWQHNREEIIGEVLQLGYQCVIKCVKNDVLPKSLLGKEISAEIIREMKEINVDVCGENGEYHSIVLGGPLFKNPIDFECREILDFGNISAINIVFKEGR